MSPADALDAIGRELPPGCKAEMTIIGGAAGHLAHAVTTATMDIDVFQNIPAEVAAAAARAKAQGKSFDLNVAGPAELPDGYVDRLLVQKFHGLTVLIPDRYDWVLSKACRYQDSDEQHIRETHAHEPLLLEVLVQRFNVGMRYAAGWDNLRINFLNLVEDLFGKEERAPIDSQIVRPVFR
jgi:hypothetical protein